MTHAVRRLTELSHGGGCGCKLSPAVLEKLNDEYGRGAAPGRAPER